MGEVVALPGYERVLEPDDTPFAPASALIRQLELALERAHAGELLAFILLYQSDDGSCRTMEYSDDETDLGRLLAGLSVEQARLANFLAETSTEIVIPEGA